MRIQPKDWKDHQHYNKRNPPWIKLHKSLLDNIKYQCLHDASKALAVSLWLLASETGGLIDSPHQQICFRLRIEESKFITCLNELEISGLFFVEHDDASTMLARCYHDASRETETETETETNKRQLVASDKPTRPAQQKKVSMSDDEWMISIKSNPAYQGIDVDREYGKMSAWCQTNSKQATRKRFLNWLNRVDRPMSDNQPQRYSFLLEGGENGSSVSASRA